MHILTKIVVVLVVLFIVLPALGFTVFEALLPQLGSAITSTVTSYFSSASSNRTFSSSGVSFNYPANWVSFSPDIISKFVNTQTFTNNTNYTLSMVVPGSLMGGQLLQAPSLILNLLTNKTNLSGVINAMTKNMNAVLAGSVDYKNTTAITPLWHTDVEEYMHSLVSDGFKAAIISVSAEGLDSSWLGKEINEETLRELITLSRKYRFHLGFEGGEAETTMLDGPIFKKRIVIKEYKVIDEGQKHYMDITKAELEDKV